MKVLTDLSIEKKMQAILQELNIYYPNTSFSISKKEEKDKIFLTVSYTDGPLRAKAKSILQPFTAGLYTSTGERRICLNIERNMSAEVEASLLAETKRILRIDKQLTVEDILPTINQTAGAYILDVFRFREF